jgi:hypothetical protein
MKKSSIAEMILESLLERLMNARFRSCQSQLTVSVVC